MTSKNNRSISAITLDDFINKNFTEKEIIRMKKRAEDEILKEMYNVKQKKGEDKKC